MVRANILVVEDNAAAAGDMQLRLEAMGYAVPCVALSAEESMNKAHQHKPGLILMNVMLPGAMDGIDAAGRILMTEDVPLIYLAEYADEEILVRAKMTEPYAYLIKPVSDQQLQGNIEIALYKYGIDRKLKENEKRLFTVLRSIGDAVITTDMNENIRFMNPVAESLTGWTNNESVGKPVEDIFKIVNEGTGEKVQSPVRKVLESGLISGLANHTVLIAKNGTKIPIDDSGAPVKDEKGNITGAVVVFHSIVERRKAEVLVVQAKQDWEDTFNTITDMITIHDKDFNIIRANVSAKKFLGMPPQGTIKRKCFTYYHGTDAPPKGCPSCKCLETQEPTAFEIFEPHLGMDIEIRSIPRFDRDNRFIGLIHVVRDITERKKIENEIKKAKAEWEITFDSASEFIILVDKELKISRCNKRFAECLQKPASEIIGRKCSEFFPCDILRDDETRLVSNVEVQSSSGHWLYLSSYSIFNEQNEFLHTIIIATDITDLKKTQQKLLKSEEELKTRIKELEDFYDMAVGRELKMKELKTEIARLNEKLSAAESRIS